MIGGQAAAQERRLQTGVKVALPDGRETIESFRDRIVLHDVSFDYGDEPVLRGVNLEICRGEIVALVGPSGVGKSTLADLILRLYDPVEGRITIDGRDVRRLRQDSYRRLFGVVPQEAILFNTTIRENIAYGRPSAAEADIVAAARVANAHDFVVELPDGYDTMVGERGIKLSGGQRQRVAIARAILKDAPILILDEATSSLDSESEALIQDALWTLMAGRTAIVIAHRLSTVRRMDSLVVLDRGRIVEQGTHEDLLALGGIYASLWAHQSGGFLPATDEEGVAV